MTLAVGGTLNTNTTKNLLETEKSLTSTPTKLHVAIPPPHTWRGGYNQLVHNVKIRNYLSVWTIFLPKSAVKKR